VVNKWAIAQDNSCKSLLLLRHNQDLSRKFSIYVRSLSNKLQHISVKLLQEPDYKNIFSQLNSHHTNKIHVFLDRIYTFERFFTQLLDVNPI
jgi:hypothetical protein